MTHRFAPLALIALGLAACASPSERRVEVRDDESFAMHILRAADIRGLRDAPREAATNFGGLETGVVGASDIGRIGHVALSAANPIGGASALGAGLGAGLLSFFLIPGDEPAESSGIIAWAPIEYGATAEAAQNRLHDEIETAFKTAIAEADTPRATIKQQGVIAGSTKVYEQRRSLVARWQGPICQDMQFQRCELIVGAALSDLPRKTKLPDILGGYEGWGFTRGYGGTELRPVAITDEFFSKVRAVIDDLSIYVRASEMLPKWVYIYIAPLKAGFRDENGDLKLYPLPVILNEGRAHYFVKGARGGQALQTSF